MESTNQAPSAGFEAPSESLGPHRACPTTIDELMAAYPARDDVRDALSKMTLAFRVHFPHNIFLDLDLVAETLVRKSTAEVDETAALVAELAAQFGGKPIQFRYVHDFLYGFDWQKWVQADPRSRCDIGPFDAAFLRWLLVRAGELRDLIAQNDAKYHRIDETVHRNPFPFSRTTDDERRLYRTLASRQLLPVETYARDGRTRADLPFYRLREAVAAELGICMPAKRSTPAEGPA